MVNYNGTYYYYLRDGQGSIIKLIDGNGATVVSYSYDPWGACTTSGTMASTLGSFQPFRYRGYVYDEETGLYYLQSRYYDPTTGRFISADTLLSTGQGVLGHNAYAYCSDNPIIRIDISGKIDYIFKLDGTYTVEDNRNSFEKFFGIQTPDKYYIEVDGIRYLANSKETVTLYAFDNIELDFLDTKFDELISEAEEETVTFERIMAESIGGNLDFKLQLDDPTLYYADGIVYNKNEMGNFMWSYLLKKNGYGRLISGSLAQGGSLFGKQHRFDESHDVKARKAGIAYYHIVEQSQISKSGFSPQMIQNTNNIISISKTTHRAISGYYSSVQPFTNGMIVRNWLAGQSFNAQYEFGINVIKMFM